MSPETKPGHWAPKRLLGAGGKDNVHTVSCSCARFWRLLGRVEWYSALSPYVRPVQRCYGEYPTPRDERKSMSDLDGTLYGSAGTGRYVRNDIERR